MSAIKTGLCSAAILAAGIVVFANVTHGFSAYTTESALRQSVQAAPRALPAVQLQAADGSMLSLGASGSRRPAGADGVAAPGPWRVAGFMYTRCTTVCSVQGSEFAQLQQQLAPAIAQGQVELLSISFDPAHDTPAALRRWQQRFAGGASGWASDGAYGGVSGRASHGASGEAVTRRALDGSPAPADAGWRVARPLDDADLDALLRVFGVKAIADGLGGYEHNAAFNLIDPQGRLVAVLDWRDPQAAAQRIRSALASEPGAGR
ncbi:SCO family protein [Castellaniella sp.]|uniref:SCO family protein n=1 Tax=Castellaniella sp. TaxID=1955812 RepID=UPI00356619C9